MTLHLAYNGSDVDNRFWVSGGSTAESIYVSGPPDGDAPLGRFSVRAPIHSIHRAHELAAAKLGVHRDQIKLADYLKAYVK